MGQMKRRGDEGISEVMYEGEVLIEAAPPTIFDTRVLEADEMVETVWGTALGLAGHYVFTNTVTGEDVVVHHDDCEESYEPA